MASQYSLVFFSEQQFGGLSYDSCPSYSSMDGGPILSPPHSRY